MSDIVKLDSRQENFRSQSDSLLEQVRRLMRDSANEVSLTYAKDGKKRLLAIEIAPLEPAPEVKAEPATPKPEVKKKPANQPGVPPAA